MSKSTVKQEIVSVNGKPINTGYGVMVIPNTNIVICYVDDDKCKRLVG